MLLILEIAMLVFGIIALVKGEFKLTRKKVVTGSAARIVGVILLVPLPLAFGIGFLLGVVLAAQGRQAQLKDLQTTITLIELAVAFGCAALAVIVALATARTPAKEFPEFVEELEMDE